MRNRRVTLCQLSLFKLLVSCVLNHPLYYSNLVNLTDPDVESIQCMVLRKQSSSPPHGAALSCASVAPLEPSDPKLAALLNEFSDVLPSALPAGLPPSRGVEHTIELLPGQKPPALPLRRYSPKEDAEMVKQVQAGIEKGHIRPSESPFGAMV